VVSFTPRPLYPQGKSSGYPLDRRLGGPKGRSGHGGEEERSHHYPRRELNPGRGRLPNFLRVMLLPCSG
jgi:hypothetical protein